MVDFAARLADITRVQRAISHDYNSWRDSVDEGPAFCPMPWASKMLDILKLPVSPWNDPGFVAGEIDTEKKAKNMYKINDDVYGRLDNTKKIEERDPFIGEGQHKLVLLSMMPFQHKTHGAAIRARFEVLASQTMTIGSSCVKLWFLTRPAKFDSQANDADRFADFIRKMKGDPDSAPVGNAVRSLTRDRVQEQLARGVVIDGFGRNTSKNPAKPFVDVTWTTVAQTPDNIKAMRAQLEAKYGAAINPPPEQPQQQGYQQQGYQNQYQGQPVGPQQYQPGPVSPNQYAPQPAPMQQQYAPAPTPQQGGFLAQIPGGMPGPQGPQGGNTGGGGFGF